MSLANVQSETFDANSPLVVRDIELGTVYSHPVNLVVININHAEVTFQDQKVNNHICDNHSWPDGRIRIHSLLLTTCSSLLCAILTDVIRSLSVLGNCPSHWQDRLTEKLKILQQSKLKLALSTANKSKPKKRRPRHLPHASVLSPLFVTDQPEPVEGLYLEPMPKHIVLEKHQAFANQIARAFEKNERLPHCFTRTNLQPQMQYRMVSLVADPFSDQMDRMEASVQLKINLLKIDHVHVNTRLPLKIISAPLWTRFAVHIVVQDENTHCLRLSIYNWSHVIDTRQIKSHSYIQERLKSLLPINSCIVLLDPWLKRCQDGDLGLRCESPNTHLLMIDFETRCSTSERTNVDQLRQWGNTCYQADDNLSAIEFYTFGLRQIDEQQEKEAPNLSHDDERQHDRVRLLSNRCACYLRERHATLALADTSVLLSIDELSHVLESPKTTAGKLLFRCLSAHLHLGLFDKVESLLKSHQFGLGFIGAENSASMAILERELARLRDEANKGRYDLQGVLREQISISALDKPALMFVDLPHYHAECHRTDLFEVRRCSPEEISKGKYPAGSYGVYALKTIEPGTLIVVEQPFASVDNRVTSESPCHSINTWQRNSTVEFCQDDSLRLINEIEKQLLIGNASWITFDKLKLMQPIRQWMTETGNDQASTTSEDSPASLFRKQWQTSFTEQRILSSSYIPWRVLFDTERENPFRSKSTLGWYPLGSMFNHSCLPNCLWYLLGECLFIYVCSSTIRPGDELTLSYCPLWIASLQERAGLLRSFGIASCRCSLCSYDRSNMPQYEIEWKKFVNLRALARQENLSPSKRFGYLKQLKQIFESISKRFKQRPIGFVREFLDLESIGELLPHTCEFQEFLLERELSFLVRLSRVCRFTIKDLPKLGNPIVLFGRQMQILVEHLETSSTRVHSCDLKQWNRLLECLYEIFTFKCHSSTGDMQRTLKDHEVFFAQLVQTQIMLD